jgi:hypothetical protein
MALPSLLWSARSCSALLSVLLLMLCGCSGNRSRESMATAHAGVAGEGPAGASSAGAAIPSAVIVGIALQQGWGPCHSNTGCERTIRVDREELVLEDEEGAVHNGLLPLESSPILDIANSVEFQTELAMHPEVSVPQDGPAGPCPASFDAYASWIVGYSDGRERLAKNISGCARIEGHPYRKLFLSLIALNVAKFMCPEFQYPAGYVSGVDKPPVRPLCVPCTGKC